MNVPQDRKLSVIMLLVYLLASCVAAIVGAHFTALATITEFYAALAKPVWAPPGWLFAPVWTLLYVCMSVAVWLVWKNRSNRPVRAYSMALVCWWVQLGLNAAWPVILWLYPAGFAPFFPHFCVWWHAHGSVCVLGVLCHCPVVGAVAYECATLKRRAAR